MPLLLLLLLLFSGDGVAQITITYPRPLIEEDDRPHFPVQLLQEALRLSQSDYRLEPSKEPILQKRALRELEVGQMVDVVWTMTSIEREKRLRPIRIPIEKGLIGWRIFLTKPSRIADLEKIESWEQMQGYSMVQGHDWPDLPILKANGLWVEPASYEGAFKMLHAGRVDLFPRSVTEIWAEYKSHRRQELAIDRRVMLHYPTAMYYFVSKDNEKLAADIEQGLEKLIATGKHICLLLNRYGDELNEAGLNERLIFKLANPFLPHETPTHRDELWFDPKRKYNCSAP